MVTKDLSSRIQTIDFTRGLVMVIMALDHLRDLLHTAAATQNPTDLATTTPGIFATRWITHLCAPTFVFLSGTSAYLVFKKSGNLAESRRYLRTRGLWLILLNLPLSILHCGSIYSSGFWFYRSLARLAWALFYSPFC